MKNDGGQAFPLPAYKWDNGQSQGWHIGQEGMSLRDWFAGQALPQAMAITYSTSALLAVKPEPRSNSARIAYECADAMIKERERGV